jgi:hypothetical protein
LVFVNAIRGVTSSHSKARQLVRISMDYVCPSEHITAVLWSGWSIGLNRLASVGKRLPSRVFVVVLVLAVPSAADWPWGAGTRVRLCRHPRPV